MLNTRRNKHFNVQLVVLVESLFPLFYLIYSFFLSIFLSLFNSTEFNNKVKLSGILKSILNPS